MSNRVFMSVLALAALATGLCWPVATAHAYVGPGAGLTVLGALWAVIAALLLAFLAIVRWPLRYLLRKLRGGKGSAEQPGPEALADKKTEGEDPDHEG